MTGRSPQKFVLMSNAQCRRAFLLSTIAILSRMLLRPNLELPMNVGPTFRINLALQGLTFLKSFENTTLFVRQRSARWASIKLAYQYIILRIISSSIYKWVAIKAPAVPETIDCPMTTLDGHNAWERDHLTTISQIFSRQQAVLHFRHIECNQTNNISELADRLIKEALLPPESAMAWIQRLFGLYVD